MIDIADKENELKKYFRQQKDVAAVYIFGSYGTEYQTPLSDIDFAVLFKKDATASLMREMEIMSQLTLILKEEEVDLVNLNKAPIYLQHEVFKKGRLIFERDSKLVSNFIENMLTFYYDEQIRLNEFQEEYSRSLKEDYLDGNTGKN